MTLILAKWNFTPIKKLGPLLKWPCDMIRIIGLLKTGLQDLANELFDKKSLIEW